ELLSLATSLVRSYPGLSPADLNFHLVEARGRILPEVSDRRGRWVVRSLEKGGGQVQLNTELVSARDGLPAAAADPPGTATVMNAQHAVRQGKLLADNIAATLRGQAPKPYVHHSVGTVATLGLGPGDLPVPPPGDQGFPGLADAS